VTGGGPVPTSWSSGGGGASADEARPSACDAGWGVWRFGFLVWIAAICLCRTLAFISAAEILADWLFPGGETA
jgi:hypothetical protein